jgi:branched-chain amino acid transport system substrate-binding protein
MTTPAFSSRVNRRSLVKGAAAAGVLQFGSPFIVRALGDTPLRIGMVDPLTGVYAAVAQNEVFGAKLAVEQINAKGGVLGRPLELLIEDSANDVGTGVQKTRKLIERDEVGFIIGDVNSAIALAMAQVTAEKKVLHIVSGGHTDGITGTDCHWNVFRVCNTTRMEANSISELLFTKYGKKWHFITPDYAFGHTLQEACAANPDVLLLLPQGSDMVNCLKQIVQFGIDKQIHVAGTQQELESLAALPPEARIGIWMFEWYWKQNAPHVAEFVADIRKRTGGKVPTARTWFGFTSVHSFALVANREKTLDGLKLAKALGDLELPDDVKLQPNKVYYRGGDHQLMTSAFVGEAQAKGPTDPEDLFRVDTIVAGDKTSPTIAETGCKMQWPV